VIVLLEYFDLLLCEASLTCQDFQPRCIMPACFQVPIYYAKNHAGGIFALPCGFIVDVAGGICIATWIIHTTGSIFDG